MLKARLPALAADDVDDDLLARTLKIGTTERISRSQICNTLVKYGLNVFEIDAIYQTRQQNTWFVELESTQVAKSFAKRNDVIYFGDQPLSICMAGEVVLRIKCQWMPYYVRREWYLELFERWGEVTEIVRDTEICPQKEHEVGNGAWFVTLNTDLMHMKRIPHVIETDDGHEMLITFRGRKPLCLNCERIGHIRRDCKVMGHRGSRGQTGKAWQVTEQENAVRAPGYNVEYPDLTQLPTRTAERIREGRRERQESASSEGALVIDESAGETTGADMGAGETTGASEGTTEGGNTEGVPSADNKGPGDDAPSGVHGDSAGEREPAGGDDGTSEGGESSVHTGSPTVHAGEQSGESPTHSLTCAQRVIVDGSESQDMDIDLFTQCAHKRPSPDEEEDDPQRTVKLSRSGDVD